MMVFLNFLSVIAVFSMSMVESSGIASNSIVVVITGASSGIGKATALAFAQSNKKFRVYATMRDPSKWYVPEDVILTNDNLVVAPLDVTSDSSVDSFRRQVLEAEGKVDVIVNNAGYGVAGTLEMVDIQDAMKLFDVNVWGVVRVLQAFLPSMRSSRRGHIINLSSTSGLRGIPAFEYYTSSKFALEGLMDSLRYSIYPFNIAVTNLNAGPVVTSFTDRFGEATTGGLGTRDPSDPAMFQQSLVQFMINALNLRMKTEEAQTSESVAQVIIDIVQKKLDNPESDITNLPFNMGTNTQSQGVLESIRLVPSGWGDLHKKYLSLIEPLVKQYVSTDKNDEL